MKHTSMGRAGVQRMNLAQNDGDPVELRTWRCGTQIVTDFVAALGAEGRIFQAQFGTLDTPVAMQSAFTATLPSLAIDNSDENIIIPLGFEINVQASGAAVFHTHLAMTPQKLLNSSAQAFTPLAEGTGVLNMRSGCTRKSGTRAGHTISVTGGDYTSGAVYLTHRGNQGDLDAIALDACYKWSWKDDGILPMCEGGALAAFFYNATSGTAFGKLKFAVLPKDDFRLKL